MKPGDMDDEPMLSSPSAKVTHLEVMKALNHVIERLQLTLPEEGSEVETAVLELETLCARVIGDRAEVRDGGLSARISQAIADAKELLAGESPAPDTQTPTTPE